MNLMHRPDDKAAIDALTTRMYAAFCNRDRRVPAFDGLSDMLHPHCVLTKAAGSSVQVQNLGDFIEHRRPLLTQGSLVEFSEWETAERTWACGNIAGRCSLYEKSGELDGVPFHTRGIKDIQFVRIEGRW